MNTDTFTDILESIDKKYIFAYNFYNKKIIKKYFATWKNGMMNPIF